MSGESSMLVVCFYCRRNPRVFLDLVGARFECPSEVRCECGGIIGLEPAEYANGSNRPSAVQLVDLGKQSRWPW